MRPGGSPRVAIGEVARAGDRVRALAEATLDISVAATIDELVAAVARHARAAVGARQCAVSLTGEEGLQEVMAVSLAARYAAWARYSTSPEGSGVHVRALTSMRPVRLNEDELTGDPDWRGFGAERGRHPPLRGLLAVPIIGSEGAPLGLVQVSDRDEGDFSADDEATLTPVAQIASVAVERHRREEEVDRGRRDLAAAQRLAHVGSWFVDFDSGRLIWSEEVHRIFGVPPRVFAGTYEGFMSRVHPDDRSRVDEAMAATVIEGAPYRVEHRIVRPDGAVRTVLERAEVERDDRGRAVRMIGTVLDVTARRRAEDELRAQAERISALAEDRRRLVAASVNAEERARQRIAEVLHDGVLQDVLAARQDVLECAGSGHGEARLLSRAAAGLAEATAGLRSAVGDLHPMTLTHGGLQTALEAVATAAARRAGFALDLAVDPGAAGVHDRLILALGREFIGNAEKHARAGRVSLRVERLHGIVRLIVRDDGVGFEPGEDGAAFRVGHIGLASARERVAVLGGTLLIESAPGRGTTITAAVPSAPEALSGEGPEPSF